jgi:hypothetical protein
MKKLYSKPITRCLQIKARNHLLGASLPTSGDRHTYESFSRQYDDWDDDY